MAYLFQPTIAERVQAAATRLLKPWLLLCTMLALAPGAGAQDTLDSAARMLVHDDRVELVVTLRTDAARAFLDSLGLPRAEVARMTREGLDDRLCDLPLKQAPRLVALKAGRQPLAASRFAIMPFEDEVSFLVVWERPEAAAIELHASYLDTVAVMRGAAFVATSGADRRVLAKGQLSRGQADFTVPLGLRDTAALASPWVSAMRMPWLDLQHLLAGLDCLLLLGGLLIGVRRLKPMQPRISAFAATAMMLMRNTLGSARRLPPDAEPSAPDSVV